MADDLSQENIIVAPAPPNEAMCALTRLEVRVFFGQTRPRAYRGMSDEDYLKAIAEEIWDDMKHWSVNRFSLDVDAPTGLHLQGAWRHPLRVFADFQALRTHVTSLDNFHSRAERAHHSVAELVRDVIVPRTQSFGAIHIQGLVYPVEPPDYLKTPTAVAPEEQKGPPAPGFDTDGKLSAFFVGIAALCVLAVLAVFYVAYRAL